MRCIWPTGILGCRDARVFAAFVVGYTFSPIDLIPDPIPVLGYLDDLILVPLGIALAMRTILAEVLAEHRQKARETQGKPVNRAAAVVVVAVWLALAALAVFLVAGAVAGSPFGGTRAVC